MENTEHPSAQEVRRHLACLTNSFEVPADLILHVVGSVRDWSVLYQMSTSVRVRTKLRAALDKAGRCKLNGDLIVPLPDIEDDERRVLTRSQMLVPNTEPLVLYPLDAAILDATLFWDGEDSKDSVGFGNPVDRQRSPSVWEDAEVHLSFGKHR